MTRCEELCRSADDCAPCAQDDEYRRLTATHRLHVSEGIRDGRTYVTRSVERLIPADWPERRADAWEGWRG